MLDKLGLKSRCIAPLYLEYKLNQSLLKKIYKVICLLNINKNKVSRKNAWDELKKYFI